MNRHRLLLPLLLLAFAPADAAGDDTAEQNGQSPACESFKFEEASRLRFSSDNRFLLIAGAPGASVWDAKAFRPVTGLLKDVGTIYADFSARGNVVLTVSNNVRLWDLRSGEPLGAPITPPQDLGDEAWPVALSSDGSRVAATVTVRNGRKVIAWDVEIWSVAPRRKIVAIRHKDQPDFALFSPDGRRLLTAEVVSRGFTQGRERFHVWDAATGAEIFPPLHTAYNYTPPETIPAAFSSDGTHLVLAGASSFTVHDALTGAVLADSRPKADRAVFDDGTLKSVAFSGDGTRVLSDASNLVTVWNAVTAKPVGHSFEGAFFDAVLTPDGRRVIAAGPHTAAGEARKDDQTFDVALWDVQTGARLQTLAAFDASDTPSVAISPDGKTVAVGSQSRGEVRIFQLQGTE